MKKVKGKLPRPSLIHYDFIYFSCGMHSVEEVVGPTTNSGFVALHPHPLVYNQPPFLSTLSHPIPLT
ncbi:hypothetical protein VNO78_22973 [Psophocarpus tetragonolobus]|uniref:Uncharacterized protein n=1 Tax=Psophocarpus tetragonolobus TaxID=3891 RepID=A0AAN9S2H1_PSOTE